jgi:hypothetical protein
VTEKRLEESMKLVPVASAALGRMTATSKLGGGVAGGGGCWPVTLAAARKRIAARVRLVMGFAGSWWMPDMFEFSWWWEIRDQELGIT